MSLLWKVNLDNSVNSRGWKILRQILETGFYFPLGTFPNSYDICNTVYASLIPRAKRICIVVMICYEICNINSLGEMGSDGMAYRGSSLSAWISSMLSLYSEERLCWWVEKWWLFLWYYIGFCTAVEGRKSGSWNCREVDVIVYLACAMCHIPPFVQGSLNKRYSGWDVGCL